MRKVTFDVKHFLFYGTQMAPNSVQVYRNTDFSFLPSKWTIKKFVNLKTYTAISHGKTRVNWIIISYCIFHLKKVLSSLQLPMLEIIRKQGDIRKYRDPLSPEDPVKCHWLNGKTSQLLKWATNGQQKPTTFWIWSMVIPNKNKMKAALVYACNLCLPNRELFKMAVTG